MCDFLVTTISIYFDSHRPEQGPNTRDLKLIKFNTRKYIGEYGQNIERKHHNMSICIVAHYISYLLFIEVDTYYVDIQALGPL